MSKRRTHLVTTKRPASAMSCLCTESDAGECITVGEVVSTEVLADGRFRHTVTAKGRMSGAAKAARRGRPVDPRGHYDGVGNGN